MSTKFRKSWFTRIMRAFISLELVNIWYDDYWLILLERKEKTLGALGSYRILFVSCNAWWELSQRWMSSINVKRMGLVLRWGVMVVVVWKAGGLMVESVGTIVSWHLVLILLELLSNCHLLFLCNDDFLLIVLVNCWSSWERRLCHFLEWGGNLESWRQALMLVRIVVYKVRFAALVMKWSGRFLNRDQSVRGVNHFTSGYYCLTSNPELRPCAKGLMLIRSIL